MLQPYRIGVDLGGTKTETILLDPDGNVCIRERSETPSALGYPAILHSVRQCVAETLKHVPQGVAATIGVGIPGAINQQTGLVQNANTTCLIGKPFEADLAGALGRPVRMENDANCFTLAEATAGAAKGCQFVFGIIMGTGCGGGMCIDGRIRTGSHGIAGEWGHFSIDPAGPACYCGNPGCIETKISGSGVEKGYLQKFGAPMKMAAITEAYRQGDPRATEIFEQFLDDFGRALGGLISVLDPDIVVLGGGLSNIDELYTLGIERVRQYAFHDALKTPIQKNRLGDSAGVFGAAWIGAGI